MGECPAWYPLVRAADRLGCPPWELLERDDGWQWAEIANGVSDAEAHAREMHRR